MAIGTLTAILLGAAAFAGTSAITSSISAKNEKKDQAAAQAASDKAKQDAEQRALMETQQEAKTTTARKALLAAPTSGFGPNKNLARSFLTTL